MSFKEDLDISRELEKGGEWLGAARTWMQWNVKNGDKINWDDTHPIIIPFNKLQDLALVVATATLKQERSKKCNK